MFINYRTCVLNDYSRQGGALASIICQQPAGFRLTHSASHPTRLTTQSCTNRYRPLHTSSPVLHLLSPSPGVIMARTGGTPSNNNNTRINRPHQQNAAQRARTYSQSQSRRSSVYRTSIHSSSTTLHLSWLFRSNLPPRRGMPITADVQKRHFFGVGEIIGVLANVSAVMAGFGLMLNIRTLSHQKPFAR